MDTSIPQVSQPIETLPDAQLGQRIAAATRPCDTDPDRWFPEPPPTWDQAARRAYVATAQTLCGGCPVIAECLELTLRDESKHGITPTGIAGGRVPWERKSIARFRRRADQDEAVAA